MNFYLNELRMIFKSKFTYVIFFFIFIFNLLNVFGYFFNNVVILLENQIIEYYNTPVTLKEWGLINSGFVENLLRPIHPVFSFMNSIYFFYTISIIVFVIVAALQMGQEFRHKTIKVKLTYMSPLVLIFNKLLALITFLLTTILFSTLILSITNSFIWFQVNKIYGYLLAHYEINLNYYFFNNIVEYFQSLVIIIIAISFYSLVAIAITYFSELPALGMLIGFTPFFRFNSVISQIIAAPADVYFKALDKILSFSELGYYGIIIHDSFINKNIWEIFTWIFMVLIVLFIVNIINLYNKKIY
ncbi:hypothetical protein [Anaerobranca gottschalkii]|uniref:ABC-2 family transporter protein n=1 Tax=Anaerobranca gottschalkii DSM 13577 TaxID=1120990 RepID=A0A1I0CQ45_9FIRM|nr:hypothetical protein [Anaerobranca gottschalkii]SET21630.1 hypothetical protein SAMN03080614_10862 [Anaerobranca gottschalkii DSM 13577]